MIYEHNLNPVAVEFYSLKIHWYSLAYIFGFIFCNYYSKYLIKQKLLNLELSIIDDFKSMRVVNDRSKSIKYKYQDKGHYECVKQFIDSIKEGNSSPIPFDDIYHSSLVTLMVSKSIKENRKIFL